MGAGTKRTSESGRCNSSRRVARLFSIGSTVLVLQVASSMASDMDALSKMLASAFIADQTVFMCTFENTAFATQTAGGRGTSRDYLEHVKKEVLNDIPLQEARQIIVGAANIARAAGHSQIKEISPNDSNVALRNWCESEGVRIVRDFMAKHDVEHEKFLREVAEAKRPLM